MLLLMHDVLVKVVSARKVMPIKVIKVYNELSSFEVQNEERSLDCNLKKCKQSV